MNEIGEYPHTCHVRSNQTTWVGARKKNMNVCSKGKGRQLLIDNNRKKTLTSRQISARSLINSSVHNPGSLFLSDHWKENNYVIVWKGISVRNTTIIDGKFEMQSSSLIRSQYSGIISRLLCYKGTPMDQQTVTV